MNPTDKKRYGMPLMQRNMKA